jgi:hypothetical protein
LRLNGDDNAASCAEDVLTSIETKLALLDKTMHFDNSRKRVTGARAAKATAGGSPRTTGKSHRVSDVAQVPMRSRSHTQATAALCISTTFAPEPASSESPADYNVADYNDADYNDADYNDASSAPIQQQILEIRSDHVHNSGAVACTLSAANSSYVPIILPDTENDVSCASPSRDGRSTITTSNLPCMDLFSSIEAKLALLSSVVVPPQFKKRPLGARRHPPAGQPTTGTNSASAAPRAAAVKVTKPVPKRSNPQSKHSPEALAVCHNAGSSSGIVSDQERTSSTSTPEPRQREGALPSADAVAVEETTAELYSTQGVPCISDPNCATSQLAESNTEAGCSTNVVSNDQDSDVSIPPLFPHASASEAQSEPIPNDAAPDPAMCVTPFGLSLEKERGGGYVVSAVTPASSASAESRLKKGVLVLELNGQSCKGMEQGQVDAMLQGTGFSELRVTVKKSWFWGTTTVVLKKLEEREHAGATRLREQTQADAVTCVTPGQVLHDLNFEVDKEVLARAAVAVASERAVLDADSMNRGGGTEDGKDGDNDYDRDSHDIHDGIAAGKIAEQVVKQETSGGCNSSNRDKVFIETIAAVERSLQSLSCNVRDFDKRAEQKQRQPLRLRTTQARAHVAAGQCLATSCRGHDGAVPVIHGGGDDQGGAGVENSVHEAMTRRLGDGVQASTAAAAAAAAVAEAATSTDLRRRVAEEKELSDKAALAEVVARQSALSLEARAVIAGAAPPYSAFFMNLRFPQ